MKIDLKTPASRGIAWLFVFLQPLIGWPLWATMMLVPPRAMAQEQQSVSGGGEPQSSPTPEPSPVPEVSPTPSNELSAKPFQVPAEAQKGHDEGIVKVELKLAAQPTDADLQMARVFEEPLAPVGDQVVPGENAALGEALMTFAGRKEKENVKALDHFLELYPDSRWKVALLTNTGILRRKAGYFTEALARLEDAWAAGKTDATTDGRALANRALGELVDLNARFGRYERMKELFDETDDRGVQGSPQTQIRGAKEGYWRMTQKTAEGFRCGPYALNAVLDAGKRYVPDPEISKEPSSLEGTNLKQLKALATKVGMNYVPARKSEDAKWVVPMVVHWKVGHFAAIAGKINGKYLVKDPTFGGEIWVSKKALDTEGSGYGMVAMVDGKLPQGWTALTDEEAAEIRGKGGAAGRAIPTAPTTCEDCHHTRMAQFDMLKMEGKLEVTDYPVGYQPQVGPEVDFMVRYRHLDDGPPSSINYPNFGPYWTSNWISYIEVDGGGSVTLKGGTGGIEFSGASGYQAVSASFARAFSTGTVMHKTNESRYEREWPNGTREVFAQPDGTGRIFLKEIIDLHGNKVVLNYDGNYRLTSIVDAIGQSTAITYVSNTPATAGFYKISRVADPFGRYADFTYNAGTTQLEKITDVIGIESSFTYDTNSFMTRLTTPYGNTDFFQYFPAEDGTARGLEVILPDGSQEALESYTGHAKTSYYWDRKAMALAPWDRSKAEQTEWLMSEEGHLMMDAPLWTKKALEGPVNYEYPDQPAATISPDPLDPPDTIHSYVGSFRKPSKITRTLDDASEQTYRYEYNDLGKVTKYVDPIGRTFSLSYAANNFDLLEVRQTKGGNSDLLGKFTYDSKHCLLTKINSSGRKTIFTYNARSQVTTMTNPKAEVTSVTYDSQGNLTQIDGPLSGNSDRTEATYDSIGRLTTVTYVEGSSSAFLWTGTLDYDALDRITKVTYPDATTEETVYSRLDTVRSKDRLGRWTNFVSNSLGQTVEVRDPAGQVTQYEWCRCGALQGLTDPNGNLTKWTYDVQGRITKKTYADGSHQDYAYEDTISRLKTVTDPAGNVAHRTYNLDNRVAGLTWDPASGFADVPDVTVTWDADYPRMTAAGDTTATYTVSYNPYVEDFYGSASNGRGKMAGITGSGSCAAVISYQYDELGREVDRQVDGSSNESTWSYDAAGRLSSWTNVLGTFTPSYVNSSYGVDRMASISFPNGQMVNYDWEDKTGDFRTKEIQNLGASSTPLSKFDYVTDVVSRISQWKQQVASATPQQYNLGYNAVDELASAGLVDTGTSAATLKQNFYAYDPVGNRTSEQIDNTVRSASFNNLNQMTYQANGGSTRFKGALSKAGYVTVAGQKAWMTSGTNFQADVNLAAGTNTVTIVASNGGTNTGTNNYQVVIAGSGTSSMSYDANGNMTGDGINTYGYDAMNRLVKVTYNGNASSEFTYDVFGRRVKISEKDSGGTTTSTKQFLFDGMKAVEQRNGGNVVSKRYFGDGFRDVANSLSYYYTKDHLGSLREIMGSDGSTIAARYDYDPYGRMTKVSGSVDGDFLYTGYYNHMGSGLFLSPTRAYASHLGRFISRDPIGEAGGINLYAYVANDPVNSIDLFGLFNISPDFRKKYPKASERIDSLMDRFNGKKFNAMRIFGTKGPVANNDLYDFIKKAMTPGTGPCIKADPMGNQGDRNSKGEFELNSELLDDYENGKIKNGDDWLDGLIEHELIHDLNANFGRPNFDGDTGTGYENLLGLPSGPIY